MTAGATAPVRRAAAEWELWTTTVRVVVSDGAALGDATALLHDFLAEVEAAASRFRPDSEVSRIARSRGTHHQVSPLLAELVAAALGAAMITGGSVDPTVGTVLDQWFRPPHGAGPNRRLSTVRAASWRDVQLHGTTLRLPSGTLLDLGATGKAFAADRAAESLSAALGCGVLVSLGGDLRAAGPDREEKWTVLVRDRADQPASLVDLDGARAIATSSSLHRTLPSSGAARSAHHVIDPVTTRPVEPLWRTVSVAAETCVEANTWSTAALVRGPAAVEALDSTGLPARLVAADGTVQVLGGWPR